MPVWLMLEIAAFEQDEADCPVRLLRIRHP
jgi:hypothetical protein